MKNDSFEDRQLAGAGIMDTSFTVSVINCLTIQPVILRKEGVVPERETLSILST